MVKEALSAAKVCLKVLKNLNEANILEQIPKLCKITTACHKLFF